jgi:signal transduction histidine kinase
VETARQFSTGRSFVGRARKRFTLFRKERPNYFLQRARALVERPLAHALRVCDLECEAKPSHPMPLHAIEQKSLQRQVTLARPLLIVLALVTLLLRANSVLAAEFLAVYLGMSVIVVLGQFFRWGRNWKFPLLADILALAIYLFITSSVVSFWFLLLIVAFAAGVEWGGARAYGIVIAAMLAVVALGIFRDHDEWRDALRAVEVAGGTLIAGLGMAYLGDRNRQQAAEMHFLADLSGMFRVERGLAESLRSALAELSGAFNCERAILVHRDADLERIYVWKFVDGETEHLVPENLPLAASDGFLFDLPDASVGWTNMQKDGEGDGFGWNRKTGTMLSDVPRIPGPTRELLELRSVLSVTMDVEGQPTSRVLLANSRGNRKRFTPRDLHRLERIVRHVGPPMENLFLLRHLRARALEAERSRISRDLHDGILQTLLSVEIQIDVLRRKMPQAPDQVESGLGSLQQTVRNEGAELRRMVTDLRPLRVQSADLLDLMRGFAERFRNEAAMHVELLVAEEELQAPDRVCRELFQIYREALNNIKKHARATHVVVKLTQSDSRITLVVDDNGEGFSFAGRFSGDELDRLRLGPISIKERARTVGGVLTVESSPGHGARLTVEVPLG